VARAARAAISPMQDQMSVKRRRAVSTALSFRNYAVGVRADRRVLRAGWLELGRAT
jgi:hypothetical protein